jgi:hypothetical protein
MDEVYVEKLPWYVQRWMEDGKGAVVAVRVCGVDRRCCVIAHSLMTRLVEEGLARRHKQGVYLIKRRAVEEVVTALKKWT